MTADHALGQRSSDEADEDHQENIYRACLPAFELEPMRCQRHEAWPELSRPERRGWLNFGGAEHTTDLIPSARRSGGPCQYARGSGNFLPIGAVYSLDRGR